MKLGTKMIVESPCSSTYYFNIFSAPSRRSSISHVGHTRQTTEMEKRLGEYSELSFWNHRGKK